MAPFLALFETGKLSAANLTAIYLVTMLSYRFPGQWPGARRPELRISHDLNFNLYELKDLGLSFEPNVEKRLEDIKTLGDLFNHFALKSTPETVNRSLLNWSNGSYGLELMFRIPDSLEVLAQQKRGRRCVSVLTQAHRCQSYILGERDALSFTMHDLIHADHFYFHPSSHEGQLGFYALMDFCLRHDHFEEQMKNKKFSAELDYLISDMNAYPVHLLKCLKAALFFYHQHANDYFTEWLEKIRITEDQKKAFQLLNSEGYIAEIHDSFLLDMLGSWKRQTP